jgi:hypothetical protein
MYLRSVSLTLFRVVLLISSTFFCRIGSLVPNCIVEGLLHVVGRVSLAAELDKLWNDVWTRGRLDIAGTKVKFDY